MPPTTHSDSQFAHTLIDAGRALSAKIIENDDTDTAPAVIIPEGYKVEYLKPEEAPPRPFFIQGSAQCHDAASFVAYVNLFKKHTTQIAAKFDMSSTSSLLAGARFVAAIDYHEAGKDGEAQYNAHRVIYALPLSVEMRAWLGINGAGLSQGKLATFLDDHLRDIASPAAAAVLELSEGMEATKTASFQSKIDRHKGGLRLAWEENVEAKTSAGFLEIPKRLTLVIPVFEGGAPQTIEARVGIDVQNGKAAITITLLELHVVARAALASVRADIDAGTGIVSLLGEL